MINIRHLGRTAVLELRHGKANALDTELCRELMGCLEQIRSSHVSAVIITSEGRIFSAGVDLLRVLAGGHDYLQQFLPVLRDTLKMMFLYPKPMIAAVNGHAIAGGCLLACAGDRRLMVGNGARIGVTELLVGLPFPVIAMEIMRFAVASHRFRDVVFSGQTFLAEQGIELGLVDEVVEASALMDRALAAAEELAARSPSAFALTKDQMRRSVLEQVQRFGPQFDQAVDAVWLAPDTVGKIGDYVSRTFKKP